MRNLKRQLQVQPLKDVDGLYYAPMEARRTSSHTAQTHIPTANGCIRTGIRSITVVTFTLMVVDGF